MRNRLAEFDEQDLTPITLVLDSMWANHIPSFHRNVHPCVRGGVRLESVESATKIPDRLLREFLQGQVTQPERSNNVSIRRPFHRALA